MSWDYWNSLWDEFDRTFKEIDEMIGRIFRTVRRASASQMAPGLHYLGFSVPIGHDGSPKLRQFGNVRPTPEGLVELGAREPFYDVGLDEERNLLKITAEMPGLRKEDTKVEASEFGVEIRGERSDRKYYCEIPLRTAVKPESAKARYNNGVLEVELELMEPIKRKGVEVKVD